MNPANRESDIFQFGAMKLGIPDKYSALVIGIPLHLIYRSDGDDKPWRKCVVVCINLSGTTLEGETTVNEPTGRETIKQLQSGFHCRIMAYDPVSMDNFFVYLDNDNGAIFRSEDCYDDKIPGKLIGSEVIDVAEETPVEDATVIPNVYFRHNGALFYFDRQRDGYGNSTTESTRVFCNESDVGTQWTHLVPYEYETYRNGSVDMRVITRRTEMDYLFDVGNHCRTLKVVNPGCRKFIDVVSVDVSDDMKVPSHLLKY
jgi:hypothetical protein